MAQSWQERGAALEKLQVLACTQGPTLLHVPCSQEATLGLPATTAGDFDCSNQGFTLNLGWCVGSFKVLSDPQ